MSNAGFLTQTQRNTLLRVELHDPTKKLPIGIQRLGIRGGFASDTVLWFTRHGRGRGKRTLLAAILSFDPTATWTEHEGMRCRLCGRWYVGLDAMTLRTKQDTARMSGTDIPRCGEQCT